MNQESGSHYEEEIDILKFLTYLWAKRGGIIAAGLGSGFIVGLCVFAVYAFTPVRRNVEQPFRLAFEGASKNLYPNGSRFGIEEIVDPVVLEEVWKINKLAEYVGLDRFLHSVNVVKKDSGLFELDSEFQASLKDAKLTPVDRERLVSNYREQRRKLSESMGMVLVFSEVECKKPLPEAVKLKVLRDVLVTWTDIAETRKGVMKFQVSIVTDNAIPEDLLRREDPLIIFDIFKSFITKVRKGAEELVKLPNGNVVRERGGSGGAKGVSVGELLFELDMLEKHQLQPILGLIRDCGALKSSAIARRYLEQRIVDVKLDQQRSMDAQRVLVDALQQYVTEKPQNMVHSRDANGRMLGGNGGDGSPGTSSQITGVAPQISESFFDKLINLSSVGVDRKFKQDITERFITEGVKVVECNREVGYYENLVSLFSDQNGVDAANSDAGKKNIIELLTVIHSALTVKAQQLENLYNELSKVSLSPQTFLYICDEPGYTATVHLIEPKKLLMYGCVAFILLWGSSVTVYFLIPRRELFVSSVQNG